MHHFVSDSRYCGAYIPSLWKAYASGDRSFGFRYMNTEPQR